MTKYERIIGCLKNVRSHTDFVPKVALVLGSGLGAFAEAIQPVATIRYNDIDGFPVSTVPGHNGRFVFGYVGDVPVVVMQGRVHYYEGYPMEDVVLPVRLMRAMGAETLFLTNASGGINTTFSVGDFMIITDHISSYVPSPLIGANIGELGTRFPDMTEVYDRKLREIIDNTAKRLDIKIQHGVYVQLTGPSYETPAEISALRILGADAVGMSTVCEAIAAKHAGFRICGISCVSNAAAGLNKAPLTHAEVQTAMDAAAPRFKSLLYESIIAMCK